MERRVINFSEKLDSIREQWAPRIVAQMNDYHFKLAKVKGEFIWHDHPETDEVFIVIKGSFVIQLRDGEVELNEGEMYVVPKGIEHKPVAEEECHILLIEPMGTVNTGEAGGKLTAENDVWI